MLWIFSKLRAARASGGFCKSLLHPPDAIGESDLLVAVLNLATTFYAIAVEFLHDAGNSFRDVSEV